jgi:hypothetical protein
MGQTYHKQKCIIEGCNRNVFWIDKDKKNDAKYCKIHKCSKIYCYELRYQKTDFCKEHKCSNRGCLEEEVICGYCNICYNRLFRSSFQ